MTSRLSDKTSDTALRNHSRNYGNNLTKEKDLKMTKGWSGSG